jgi:hypothetical protein
MREKDRVARRALAVIAALVLSASGCELGRRDQTLYVISYEVYGSAGSASVTYSNEDGGTQQEIVSLPWKTKFHAREGHFLYISAQGRSERGGVTVEIKINGVQDKMATSSGGFTIASVSDRCCQ